MEITAKTPGSARIAHTVSSAILAGVLTLGLVGCRKADESGDGASASPSTTASAPADKIRSRPSDPSLALEKYIDAGVPAADRLWSPADYQTAAAAIGRIGAQRDALPRWHSAKSGALFERMVDPRNLDLLRDAKTSVEVRVGIGLGFLQESGDLSRMYLARSASVERELVECIGFELRVTVEVIRLAGQFATTLDPKDPKYGVRLGGFAKMRDSLAEMVSGSLTTLEDKSHFSQASRLRLCELLRETLPDLLPELPEGTRREVPVRIARLEAGETDGPMRAAVESVRTSIATLRPRQPVPDMPPAIVPAATTRADWQECISKDGAFRARLPAPGMTMSMDTPNEVDGGKMHMEMIATQLSNGIKFVVIRLGPVSDPKAMSRRLANTANGFKGETVKQHAVTLGGLEGNEISVGDPPKAMFRVAPSGAVGYVLIVDAQNPLYRVSPRDAEEFFDSFQVAAGAAATRPVSGK